MKHVLLIGGGGTLGTYTAKELLRLGHKVDVICLEDHISEDPRLRFIKAKATESFLRDFLQKQSYQGIVNFIHYPDVEEYKRIHPLLIRHTEHLVFLSSYRVYADLQHPITENAPMLLDVLKDPSFLEKETYAASKARAEKYLCAEHTGEPWTIVRPVISFSQRRFDLFTCNLNGKAQYVFDCVREGKPAVLPECAKHLTAGLDWAGNSGKLIANLLFKPETFGQAYTISSAQNLLWSEVAALYTKLIGLQVEYIPTEDFIRAHYPIVDNGWIFWYDRYYDRPIDNSKVMKATGLRAEDLLSIEEGLKNEIALYRASLEDKSI